MNCSCSIVDIQKGWFSTLTTDWVSASNKLTTKHEWNLIRGFCKVTTNCIIFFLKALYKLTVVYNCLPWKCLARYKSPSHVFLINSHRCSNFNSLFTVVNVLTTHNIQSQYFGFSTFASTKNLHYYLPVIIFLILKYGVDTKAIVNLFSYKKEGSYFCRKILFTLRSSHRWCSVKKGVLSNFAKFTGKHLCQSFFFNKVIKKETGTGVFLWILRNFSEHLF